MHSVKINLTGSSSYLVHYLSANTQDEYDFESLLGGLYFSAPAL